MKLAFLLHLYQPPTQTETAFRAIAHECYTPLIKLLKSHTDFNVTLNVPLSLLEQLSAYGYTEIITSIKELVESHQVELTGSAAYHPLLTKTLFDFPARQIVLNEYALGYYFGQRQGFEGELSVMAKDIRGFFPPEMAINTEVLQTLDELEYDWTAVDSSALGIDTNAVETVDASIVFKVENAKTVLVVRNTGLSNAVSFRRDGNVTDLTDSIKNLSNNGVTGILLGLDAEVFGHHNKEGIYYLGNLIKQFSKDDISTITVSELVKGCKVSQIVDIKESTWSVVSANSVLNAKAKKLTEEEIYPFWLSPKNEVQQTLWQLQKLVSTEFHNLSVPAIVAGFENIEFWNPKVLDASAKNLGEQAVTYLKLELLINKALHSDQFWWASGKTVYDKVLYSPQLVENALKLYTIISGFDLMTGIRDEILELTKVVSNSLQS